MTSTFYPSADDVRAHLAYEMVRNATARGYRVLVVDDGSPLEVIGRLLSAGAIVEEAKAKGNVNCRPQAFCSGWDLVGPRGAVCFLEAEKVDLPQLADLGFAMILDGGADLVNFNRTQSAHSTYPPFQFHSERAGNDVLRLILNSGGRRFGYIDGFYGGRVVGAGGIEYFANPDETTRRFAGNWGITHLPMLKMIADGKNVRTADVDIQYPVTQWQAEHDDLLMGLRRITQLVSLTEGTLAYAEAIGLVDAGTLETARKKLKFGMPQ